jgi:hypothetical protein
MLLVAYSPASNSVQQYHGQKRRAHIGDGDSDGDVERVNCPKGLRKYRALNRCELIACSLYADIGANDDPSTTQIRASEDLSQRALLWLISDAIGSCQALLESPPL